MNKEPFVISVPDATLMDLHERLTRTRWPEELDNEVAVRNEPRLPQRIGDLLAYAV